MAAFFKVHLGGLKLCPEWVAKGFAFAQKDLDSAMGSQKGGTYAALSAAKHGNSMGKGCAHFPSGV